MVPTVFIPWSSSSSLSGPFDLSVLISRERSDSVDHLVTRIRTVPAPLARLLLTIATAVNASGSPIVCAPRFSGRAIAMTAAMTHRHALTPLLMDIMMPPQKWRFRKRACVRGGYVGSGFRRTLRTWGPALAGPSDIPAEDRHSSPGCRGRD